MEDCDKKELENYEGCDRIIDLYAEDDYKFCIDCWCAEGDYYEDGAPVKFYNEGGGGRSWQHTQRCKRCEDLYVWKFVKKYPNTKTLGYKFVELDDDLVNKIEEEQRLKYTH